MRRFSRIFVAVAAACALALAAPPAGASHIQFVGEVSGTATVSISLQGVCGTSTYNFGSLEILMAATDGTAAKTFGGSLSTDIVTGSGSDCGAFGYGTIAGNPNTGGTPGSFQNATGTTTGQFWGTFTRVGAKVDASLKVKFIKINNLSVNDTVDAFLDVTLFAPTGVSGDFSTLNKATFAGEFHTGANAPGSDTICAQPQVPDC